MGDRRSVDLGEIVAVLAGALNVVTSASSGLARSRRQSASGWARSPAAAVAIVIALICAFMGGAGLQASRSAVAPGHAAAAVAVARNPRQRVARVVGLACSVALGYVVVLATAGAIAVDRSDVGPTAGDCPRPLAERGTPMCRECDESSPGGGVAAGSSASVGLCRGNRGARSAGRHLPRHRARSRAHGDLPGRRRAAPLPGPPRQRGRAPRLALPRVLPDDEPLPPGRRDPALAPLGRHAPPERHLRPGLQPAATAAAATSSASASPPGSCATNSTCSRPASTSCRTRSAQASATTRPTGPGAGSGPPKRTLVRVQRGR